jgi:decaprenylphospho-beta-D-erythro-pentofuranosid-2-ulose 2-reductase
MSNSKKMLVFGATSAIAVAVQRELVGEVSSFCLCARSPEKLESVAQDLRQRGAVVTTMVADLDQLSAHQELVSALWQKNAGFDVCLLAQGTLADQARAQEDFTLAHKELHTNFIAPASLLSALAPLFEAQRSGVLMVITSVAGDRGRASNYVYGSAKGALSIWCQGLRNRLAPSGVRLMTIKPGFVATPMTAHLKQGPLFASPQRVARGIVRGLRTGGEVIYVPWFWCFIMLVIKLIPERIFKRLSL